jgi:hypothetical protein
LFAGLIDYFIIADFSKEYQQKYFPSMGWDFSIKSLFANLKEGEMIPEICEGFVFNEITREDGKCILMYSNIDEIEFEQLDSYIKEKGLLPD